jgi:hypothetical protein
MNTRNDIIQLEKKFFQTMVEKNGAAATALCTEDVIVGGSKGAMTVKGADMGKMMAQGKWELHDFELADVAVTFPNDRTAVIGYKITQNMTVEGKPTKLVAADTSTWVSDGEEWLCCAHTETPIGDAHGRK